MSESVWGTTWKNRSTRVPFATSTNNAEPSIVRTHLRLKHREFDLNPVNDRHK